MAEEKTEKATFKKQRDTREKGNAFQSQDLTSAVSLFCIFGVLKICGPTAYNNLRSNFVTTFSHLNDNIQTTRIIQFVLSSMLSVMVSLLLPLFLASVVSSVGLTLIQTRFLVTPAAMAPKFERISLLQGVKRLFSLRSIVEVLKSIIKICIIALVIWSEIYPKLPQIVTLFDVNLTAAIGWTGQLIIDIVFKVAAFLLCIGVFDYFYQWWDFERSIRMSHQELKDEFKETEGNPQTKSRIRNLQRKMSRVRMMSAVPKADVVVRNPTHLAIALKYDAKSKRAPVVVAKGANDVALRIVKIASENGVYITENIPLAHALYKSVDIGSEIPAEFYKAVAEVLAYIYKMKRAGRS